MDKINRLAESLGINEDFAAAVEEHLRKTQGLPPEGWGEAEGLQTDSAGSPDSMEETTAPEAPPWGE